MKNEMRKILLIKEYIKEFEEKEIDYKTLLNRIVSTIIDEDYLNFNNKNR